MLKMPHKALMTLGVDCNSTTKLRVYLKHRQWGDSATTAWRIANNVRVNGEYIPIKYLTVYPQKCNIRWLDNANGLRLQYADEIAHRTIRHTGWYTDDSYFDRLRGIVVRLPHNRFIIGYEDSCSTDEYCLHTDYIYTDEMDAALAADNLARICAENHREYNAAWQAGSQYATYKEEIAQIKEEIRELAAIRERNAPIRRLGRLRINRLIDVYGKMQELRNVPYTNELANAFNGGSDGCVLSVH